MTTVVPDICILSSHRKLPILYTVPAQIERHRSNFHPEVFGAVAFKFEPKMTVVIKNLTQKVDFLTKCCSNQDCRSIYASTVLKTIHEKEI